MLSKKNWSNRRVRILALILKMHLRHPLRSSSSLAAPVVSVKILPFTCCCICCLSVCFRWPMVLFYVKNLSFCTCSLVKFLLEFVMIFPWVAFQIMRHFSFDPFSGFSLVVCVLEFWEMQNVSCVRRFVVVTKPVAAKKLEETEWRTFYVNLVFEINEKLAKASSWPL